MTTLQIISFIIGALIVGGILIVGLGALIVAKWADEDMERMAREMKEMKGE